MAKLNEMILEQAQTIGALKHQLKNSESLLKEKATALENDLDNEVLRTELESLTGEVDNQRTALEKAETRKNTLLELEKIQGDNAKNSGGIIQPAGPQYIRRAKDPESPTKLLWKGAAVEFLSYMQRKPVEQVFEEQFKDDDALKAFYGWNVLKTAVAPANTFTAGWAQELTYEAVMGLLESLTDISVGAALTAYTVPLNFNGAATIKVPRINARDPATLTEPGWVGEGGVIPLTSFGFGSETLSRYKLAAIAPATEELARDSVTNIVALFERELSKDYAARLDLALLSSNSAVNGVRPRGLLEGYVALTATAGGGVDAVIGDITALATAFSDNNMGERPVLIMNSADRVAAGSMRSDLGQFQFADELRGGYLMGYPVISSNHVPKHMLILIDAAALALALDGPEYMVSREATLTEANADGTAPTQAEDGAGALGTVGEVPRDAGIMVTNDAAKAAGAYIGAGGYTARSLFQTYCLAVRAIFPTSFAQLRPNMLAFMNATTWTA